MKKTVLLTLFVTFLFSLVNKEETKLVTSGKQIGVIDKKLPAGLSGEVIQEGIIIAKAYSLGGNKVQYAPYETLRNDAFATPILYPKKEDKIVFNRYAHRGLIIAPSQEKYNEVEAKHPEVTWIHSDVFASSITRKPSKENFQEFCNSYNIGIIYFVLDKEYVVNCDNFTVIKSFPNAHPTPYTTPFYSAYTKRKVGTFDSTPADWIEYYKEYIKVIHD